MNERGVGPSAYDLPTIGAPIDRVDGRVKVTGEARYAAEIDVPGAVHAVVITSTVAEGRITSLDVAALRAMPGVLDVLSHENAEHLPGYERASKYPQSRIPTLMQDDRVRYNGQPIAVVIAESLEQAMEAARSAHATYETGSPDLDPHSAPEAPADTTHPFGSEPKETKRGDVDAGLAEAVVRIDATYVTPLQSHNPMEPHATIAEWTGDELTLHDSTQGIFNVRGAMARMFGVPPEKVRVISRYTGGGFGSKGGPWSHVYLAAMAARLVNRPVKLVLTRQQMFGPVGGRPRTEQRLTLGAKRDGTLTAVRHLVTGTTSKIEDWLEPAAIQTPMLYSCPNVHTDHTLVRMNVGSPTFMRAPGEATGTFALECAMDELAYALRLDPLELRLRNYAERDEHRNLPFSTKSLRECYDVASARFGWRDRPLDPRSLRDGDWDVGLGMATATYPARRMPASALARINPDGRVELRAGSQEIGQGTYTVMTQLAAEVLGISPERVDFALGDTTLPQNGVSAGSMTAASTGTAVHAAAAALRDKLAKLAVSDSRSPLYGAAESDLRAGDGHLFVEREPSRSDSYTAIVARNGGAAVEATAETRPGEETKKWSTHAFGAVFAEVHVDRELGVIRVPRVVGAYAGGRVLNAKTARSQLVGGIIWGIGMALMEETLVDPRSGRYVNADLAEYHVPTAADVGDIDVTFVEERDTEVNPIGVKGLGEIGITGVVAAIANAVWHATGRRMRELPIRLR